MENTELQQLIEEIRGTAELSGFLKAQIKAANLAKDLFPSTRDDANSTPHVIAHAIMEMKMDLE